MLENQLTNRVSEIEGCYTSTFDYYKSQATSISELLLDYKTLAGVVREHSEKLANIA